MGIASNVSPATPAVKFARFRRSNRVMQLLDKCATAVIAWLYHSADALMRDIRPGISGYVRCAWAVGCLSVVKGLCRITRIDVIDSHFATYRLLVLRNYREGRISIVELQQAITFCSNPITGGSSEWSDVNFRMGLLYRDGIGVPKDLLKAARYFRWGAGGGDSAEASRQLALAYKNGTWRQARGATDDDITVAGDLMEAVRLLEHAEEIGSHAARHDVPHCLDDIKRLCEAFRNNSWRRPGRMFGDGGATDFAMIFANQLDEFVAVRESVPGDDGGATDFAMIFANQLDEFVAARESVPRNTD